MTVNQNEMPAKSNEESTATNSIRNDRYALPLPKSSRASKQIDNTTSVNKVCMYVRTAYKNYTYIHVALSRCWAYVCVRTMYVTI